METLYRLFAFGLIGLKVAASRYIAAADYRLVVWFAQEHNVLQQLPDPKDIEDPGMLV